MVALNDISKSYSVRPLNEGETLNSFNCGDAELNDFILSKASEGRNKNHKRLITLRLSVFLVPRPGIEPGWK